jgi:hypothetical protein
MNRAKGGSRGRIQASWGSSARKAAHARGGALIRQGDLGEAAFIHKAIGLGFMVAKPHGHNHPYDFIVEGGSGFRSVQIKACSHIWHGLYQMCVCRHRDGAACAYTESEIDFVAAYIIPEETWYVLPVREVLGRTALGFRPKGYPHADPYAHYREAWHLLREPDGLTFG